MIWNISDVHDILGQPSYVAFQNIETDNWKTPADNLAACGQFKFFEPVYCCFCEVRFDFSNSL